MVETVEKTSGQKQKNPKQRGVEAGSEIAELAAMLISANRISNNLEDAITKLEVDLSLTDWLLLHALNSEPAPIAKAAYKIGVTRQRVYQQMIPLQAAGLISISSEGEKSKTLSIAPGGAALVARLENEIRKALSVESGALPTGPILTASKSTRRIVKAMAPKRKVISG